MLCAFARVGRVGNILIKSFFLWLAFFELWFPVSDAVSKNQLTMWRWMLMYTNLRGAAQGCLPACQLHRE
jgi:hypothetical protein